MFVMAVPGLDPGIDPAISGAGPRSAGQARGWRLLDGV